MTNQDWQVLTHHELEMAEEARRSGNEGRARVCARRAAGHVAGEYLARNNLPFSSNSALERLRHLHSSLDKDSEAWDIVGHFLIHTTPDHELPIDADLIKDVSRLAQQLLGVSLE